MYDDDNTPDGFDDEALARRVRGDLWRKLFRYARVHPRDLVMLAACAITTAAADVSFPLITRAVVDRAAAGAPAAELLPWGFVYLANTLVLALSVGGFIGAAGRLRAAISHDIRRDGFANLQRLSFAFYDRRPVGWLMARMTSDCERLANILAWGVLDLIWGLTLMAGIALAMLLMNPLLAALVLAVVPLLGWVSAVFQKRILRSARQVRSTNSRITAAYNEGITGVLTSKAFVREAANLQDFRGLTSRMFDASVVNQTQAAIYVPIVLTLASLASGLALAVGGFDLLTGTISAGTLVAFMAYARNFFDPIEQLGRWFAEMQMAQASAERILSLVEAEPDIRDSAAVAADRTASGTAPAPASRTRIGQVELRDVGFAYGDGPPVLDAVNLVAHRGETIALVGPTGGGKSTLVNVVCRFYEPTRGAVLVDGVDYRDRGLHWLQSRLGIVQQQAHLFSGPVRDNIRYGRLDASDAEVRAAAQVAGALPFIEALEQGWDTDVGEGGSRLSAGQKQLLSFARAILADPDILVMDEATSSVDTDTEQAIAQGLAAVLAGRIAFVIAHRLSTIRDADRILVIDGGRIVESGNHAALMAQRGRYFELYRQQSLGESSRGLAASGHAGRAAAMGAGPGG